VPDPNLPWNISIDVSLDTYTAYTDLDGVTIGPAIYHPVPTDELYPGARKTAEVTRLGGLGFDTVTKYHAPTPDGYIELYAMALGKKRATGLQRTRKVATFELSKTLPRLTASQIAAVQNMVNTVNKNTFYGAATEYARPCRM
jgi:hypothetical protein